MLYRHKKKKSHKKKKKHGSTDNVQSQKDKPKSRKKRSRETSSESAQTESTSDQSSSSSESVGSAATSSSSGSEQSAKKKSKKRRAKRDRAKVDWDLINLAWPIEDRPQGLQSREGMKGRDIDALVRFKSEIAKVEEKKELGDEAFSRDAVLKKIKFKAASDDGVKKLHPARGLRQPLALPSEWYAKLVPRKREQIVRNFPVEHYGMAGQVSQKVLGKAHNRAVTLSLDQFCRQDASAADLSVKQIQEAVINFAVVLHALWPTDYSALVVLRVLAEAGWGDVAGQDNR